MSFTAFVTSVQVGTTLEFSDLHRHLHVGARDTSDLQVSTSLSESLKVSESSGMTMGWVCADRSSARPRSKLCRLVCVTYQVVDRAVMFRLHKSLLRVSIYFISQRERYFQQKPTFPKKEKSC
jgi:hypothetical protein